MLDKEEHVVEKMSFKLEMSICEYTENEGGSEEIFFPIGKWGSGTGNTFLVLNPAPPARPEKRKNNNLFNYLIKNI